MWKKGAGNSDKYEGEYNADKKHGYGIFTWSTGNIYKGNYSEDLRSDFGEMYWSDGSYYKGQWKNGIQHGEGISSFIQDYYMFLGRVPKGADFKIINWRSCLRRKPIKCHSPLELIVV
jgi:hypothetical protein